MFATKLRENNNFKNGDKKFQCSHSLATSPWTMNMGSKSTFLILYCIYAHIEHRHNGLFILTLYLRLRGFKGRAKKHEHIGLDWLT